MARIAAIPHVITDRHISVVVSNKTFALDKSHPTFEKLRDALQGKKWSAAKKLVSTGAFLEASGNGAVSVINGKVFFKGRPVHSSLADRISTAVKEGKQVDGLLSFMNNLYRNPLEQVVAELYDWLASHDNHPISDDGCFMAFKRVNDNYTDVHTGKISNKPGDVVMMPRKNVDPSQRLACSNGLHFGTADYVNSFSGSRFLMIKINPKDVVAIPANQGKGRTWRYEVVAELSESEVSQLKASGNIQAYRTSVFDYKAGRQALIAQIAAHPDIKRKIRQRKLALTTLKKYPFARLKKLSGTLSAATKRESDVLKNPLKLVREAAGLGLSKVAKKAGIAAKTLMKLERSETPQQKDVDNVLTAVSELTRQSSGLSYASSR